MIHIHSVPDWVCISHREINAVREVVKVTIQTSYQCKEFLRSVESVWKCSCNQTAQERQEGKYIWAPWFYFKATTCYVILNFQLCGKASVLCNMTMPLWTWKKMFFSEFGAERDAQKWSGSGLESRALQPGKWVKSWDIDVVTNIQRIFAGVPQMWLSNTCGNNMKQRQDTWHFNNKLYLPQMTSVRWINTKNKSFLHYNLLNQSFLQLHISSLFTPVMGRYGSLDISVRLLCGSCYSTLIIPMICSKLFNNHTGCVAFVCTYCCPCGQRVRCDFIHTAK